MQIEYLKTQLTEAIIEQLLIKDNVLKQSPINGLKKQKKTIACLSTYYSYEQAMELRQSLYSKILKEYESYLFQIDKILRRE